MVNKDISIKDWLTKQTNKQVKDWEQAIEKFYPEYLKTWTDPREQIRALMENWNTFEAVKYLDWKTLLINRTDRGNYVLDLGTDTGWLSSFLSTFSEVRSIDALDSSKHNLSIMLPEIVKLTRGNIAKINPILGLFYPLLIENEHYDVIVASAAIHHAPNLFQALRECNRVLKKKGELVILNETPLTSSRYFLRIIRFFISVTLCLIRGNYPEYSPSVSRSGILYDPYLGDNIYSYSQWEKAIRQSGFSFKTIVTPYFPYKKKKNQVERLTHFICEKL